MAQNKGSSFILKKLITISLFIFIFAFIVILSYKSFTYDIESVLKKSKGQYIIFSSLVMAIEFLPYIFSISLLITICWLYSIGVRKGKNDLQEIDYIVGFFIFLLLTFLIITIFNEALKPFLNIKISEILITTKLSYQYLKMAKEYELAGKYTLALEYYKKYLTFEPKNIDIIDLVAELERKKYAEIPKPSVSLPVSGPPINAASLYNLAMYHTKMKEYILAIYYLERYLLLNPGDPNAKALYDKIKEIYKNEILNKKEDTLYIMQQKRLGISYIEQNKYVEAYNLFVALSKKYPNNKSIKPYLEEATNLFRKVDFFISETVEKKDYPGLNSTLFKLKDAKKENTSYLIFIDKVVYYFNEIYLFDIYLYDLSVRKVKFYKYGKKIQNYFVFKNTDYEHEITYFDLKIPYFKNFILLRSFNLFPLYTIFDLKNFIGSLGYHPKLFIDYIKEKVIFYLAFLFSLILTFKISFMGMKKSNLNFSIVQLLFFIIGGLLITISGFQFIQVVHNGLFILFTFTLNPLIAFLILFGIDLILWILIYYS